MNSFFMPYQLLSVLYHMQKELYNIVNFFKNLYILDDYSDDKKDRVSIFQIYQNIFSNTENLKTFFPVMLIQQLKVPNVW